MHDKCVDATESLYDRRKIEAPLDVVPDGTLGLAVSEEPKQKQMVVFFNTSKINFCFLQVASVVCSSESPRSPDSVIEEAKTPSVSLLAGTVSGITAEVLSVMRKPANDEAEVQRRQSNASAPIVSASTKQTTRIVE